MNYGIALCRVSTTQQKLEGNSLSAQEVRINTVARDLFDCTIEKTWSLSISSRKGKNYKRKDLEEMLSYCKRHKRIKYLFVDEHDRYMRSVEEYYGWKTRFFHEADVELVIAAKPELTLHPNSASIAMEFFGVWQGEVSNEERITKTTEKMQARVAAGYYPGNVHTGYQQTKIAGLHAPLEPQWSLLRTAMHRIIYDGYSVRSALSWLEDNAFTTPSGRKIDLSRFKRILLDPYYAGVTKFSDWDIEGVGLHQAMLSKEEYEALRAIVKAVKNKFVRQQHNPLFQMSSLVECEECSAMGKKYPKFVGYRNHNGSRTENRKYYERYACRSCRMGITKADLHNQISEKLAELRLDSEAKDELTQAMKIVWERRTVDAQQTKDLLADKLAKLNIEKSNLIRMIGTNPELASDIADSVKLIKTEIASTEQQLSSLGDDDDGFLEFIEYALNYVDNLNAQWWDLTPDKREKCKHLVFPGGIFVTADKKVSTPEISPIYSSQTSKKGYRSILDSDYGDPKESRTPLAGMKTRCPNR